MHRLLFLFSAWFEKNFMQIISNNLRPVLFEAEIEFQTSGSGTVEPNNNQLEACGPKAEGCWTESSGIGLGIVALGLTNV